MLVREIIMEGGNVFGDNTGRINREHIQPTLDKYFAELQQVFPQAGIQPNNFHPVGSVGKKSTSGDIDLAIDSTALFPAGITTKSMQQWNLKPDEFVLRFDQFKKRARSSTDEQVAMKTALVLISEYVNEHGAKNRPHDTVVGRLSDLYLREKLGLLENQLTSTSFSMLDYYIVSVNNNGDASILVDGDQANSPEAFYYLDMSGAWLKIDDVYALFKLVLSEHK